MLLTFPEVEALRTLSSDGWLLFSTRIVRLFAYGLLSVALALYLAQLGLNEAQIGLLLTLTLVGDALVSLWIASVADRFGRRRMLLVGAALMILAGLTFALSHNLALLTVAAIVGTISPSGAEVGPSAALEQAALPQTTPDRQRTAVFAWYNLAGSVATALGALCGGIAVTALQQGELTPLVSYRVVVVGYALLGGVLAALFSRLSPAVEAPARQAGAPRPAIRGAAPRWLGLDRSRPIVLKLSVLFMLDAFAGGMVVQSLIAYWFAVRFGVAPAILGAIFFGANLFAGISALAATRVAARVGLLNTMVWTHMPSNLLLMLVPLMPTLPLAVLVLLARFSISQMDVPTRQSYLVAVVDSNERAAATGVTTTARTAASAAGPLVSGALLGASLLSAPFLLAGGLKLIYDLALYLSFRAITPPEEDLRGDGTVRITHRSLSDK
jgi:MFS family permease